MFGITRSPIDFASGAPFTPGSLSGLLLCTLDQNPGYGGTLQSMPYLNCEETGTVAVPRGPRCALFDGSDDYGQIADDPALRLTGDMTISAWVYATDLSGVRFILTKESATGWATGYSLYTVNTTLAFRGGNGSNSEGGTTTTIAANVWTHVVATRTGTTYRLYVNGALANTETFATVPADTGAPTRLGQRNGASNLFKGKMFDVRLYNVAKSASEIQAIYNQASTPSTIDTSGLVAMWPLQAESGTVAYDVANPPASAKNLTLTNITQSTFHATDSGVSWNYNNWKGYTLSGSVVIPASLANPTQDAAGNALGVAGPVAHPVTGEVPCVTGDGANVFAVSASNIGISGAANRTLCFRAKLSSRSASESLIHLGDSTTNGAFNAFANANANWYFEQSGSGFDTGVATDTNWHHHALSYDGTTVRWYIDGILIASAARSLNTTNATVRLLIGITNGNRSSGSICDVRIYSDVKTLSEIQAIRDGFDNRTNIVAHWPIQEGPGTANTNRTCYDTVGTNHLTINNGTVSTIWANRCPYARDWCVENGGSHNPNMLARSQEFDNAAWSKNNLTVVANADGAADSLLETTTNADHWLTQTTSGPTGTYTWSVEIKPNGRQYAHLNINNGTGGRGAVFDLSGAGSVVGQTTINSGITYVAATITPLGDGYYRCTLTATVASGSPYAEVTVRNSNVTTWNNSYSGDVTKGLIVRNAQLEPGSVATTYQATTTAQPGAFIPGRIGSNLDAAGNAKTLTAGKHGNPYSRLVPNLWSAPELTNIGYTSSTKLAPSDAVQSISPADSKFRRSKADGSDRYFATQAALTGSNKTNAEAYVA